MIVVADEVSPVAVDADLLCGGCGQNLRGVVADRCPECGRRFDRGRTLSAAVPWEMRRQVGVVRAFVRTVGVAVFRPRRLLGDGGEPPVTLAGARAFRRLAVAVVFVASAVPMLYWFADESHPSPGEFVRDVGAARVPDLLKLLRTHWFFYTGVAAWLATLCGWTSVPGWFFAPRRFEPIRRKRAVAVSLYATSAHLVVMTLAGGLLVASRTMDAWPNTWVSTNPLAQVLFYASLFALSISILVFLVEPCRLLHALTRSRRRVAVFAVGWPLLVALTPAIIFPVLWAVVLCASLYFAG